MIWDGVPFGFGEDYDEPISYGGNAPVLVYGPPGSFKTVGLVATQILDEPGERSFIVIDPKLEVAAITAEYRRKICGKDNVKIINPYGVLVKDRPDLKSDGWNPLNDLDPDAQGFGDECAAKGDALIKPNSNDSQPIFANSARSAFTAGINFEVREARAQSVASGQKVPPSLANVRAMLSLETEQLVEIIKKMIATGDPDIVSRVRKFLNDNREIQSIKSNIETDTAWMTKPMRDDMDVAEGVDFSACKQVPTTIYIGIPTSELINKASYLRLAVSSALRALYHEDGIPVTLLVEEAFVIGHLDELEQACSILRGYNSRLVMIYQSLQQIKKRYPDTWGLFTGGAVLGFRPGDLETAEWMSKRAGEEIVPVLSASDPSSPNDLGARPSWQQQKRERIPVGTMFGMPQGRALVWLPNEEVPRVARVKGYFEIPELNARASPNPYYKGGNNIRSTGGRSLRRMAVGMMLALVIVGGLALTLAGPRGLQALLPAAARPFAPPPLLPPVLHHPPQRR